VKPNLYSDNELLLKSLVSYIPRPLDGQPNLKLVFSGDDGPTGQAHYEVVDKSIKLASSGSSKSKLYKYSIVKY
jgi:hypothetical protein